MKLLILPICFSSFIAQQRSVVAFSSPSLWIPSPHSIGRRRIDRPGASMSINNIREDTLSQELDRMEEYWGVPAQNATATTSSDGKTQQRPMKVTDAIAIIAGTAVGGGFLALPSFTSPIGYLPTALGLCLAYVFLALSALAFGEAAGLADDDARQEENQDGAGTSVASVIRQAFGRRWALLAGGGFLTQMLAVMTAQVVKGAELLAELTGLPYRLACIVPMTVTGAWVYANSPERVEGVNTILTAVMLAGFGALIASAVGRGNLLGGLFRAEWMRLLPNTKVPFALPVFVKLLAFGEAMPLLIERMVLGPQQRQMKQAPTTNETETVFNSSDAYSKLRKATFVGASLPLLLALIWAGISASLVSPTDPNPIISLLHNHGPYIAAPVLLLSYGAIGTTLLGSLLAMAHFANDMICAKLGYCSLRWSAVANALTVALPCTLACIGPSIYLPLLSFAGAYPTTLLYGLAPALAALVLRRRSQKRGQGETTTPRLVPGGERTLICLVCAAVGLVGSSTVLALRHLLVWRISPF